MLRYLRSMMSGAVRTKALLMKTPQGPERMFVRKHSHDGPPQPFDNMPFSINSRAAASIFFAVFFGLGYWAPFIIVWYAMAKRTL